MSVNEIKEKLSARGVKVTPQRMAVYKALSELEHASAEQIAARVHEQFPTVTTGTIYNVLDCFVENRIISRLNTSGNKMLFDVNVHDHHHLLCEETGEVKDFGDEELTDLVRLYFLARRGKEDFQIKDIRVQFIGNFNK